MVLFFLNLTKLFLKKLQNFVWESEHFQNGLFSLFITNKFSTDPFTWLQPLEAGFVSTENASPISKKKSPAWFTFHLTGSWEYLSSASSVCLHSAMHDGRGRLKFTLCCWDNMYIYISVGSVTVSKWLKLEWKIHSLRKWRNFGGLLCLY